KNKASAFVNGVGIGLLGSVAVMLSDAKVGGGVGAAFDGDVASSGSINVTADGRNLAETETLSVGVGLLSGAGSGSVSEVTDQADVVAGVGSTASLRTGGSLK